MRLLIFTIAFSLCFVSAKAELYPTIDIDIPPPKMPESVAELFDRYANVEHVLLVSVERQELSVYARNQQQPLVFPVSTSRYGMGSSVGSNQTPLGLHKIKIKIGDDAPAATVFTGRVNQGFAADIQQQPIATDNDYVTSRILWLDGMEPGNNQGEGVDSFSRYIYIHGTHEEGLIGQPASHGCVRMLNKDVIELYDRVSLNDLVLIIP